MSLTGIPEEDIKTMLAKLDVLIERADSMVASATVALDSANTFINRLSTIALGMQMAFGTKDTKS